MLSHPAFLRINYNTPCREDFSKILDYRKLLGQTNTYRGYSGKSPWDTVASGLNSTRATPLFVQTSCIFYGYLLNDLSFTVKKFYLTIIISISENYYNRYLVTTRQKKKETIDSISENLIKIFIRNTFLAPLANYCRVVNHKKKTRRFSSSILRIVGIQLRITNHIHQYLYDPYYILIVHFGKRSLCERLF